MGVESGGSLVARILKTSNNPQCPTAGALVRVLTCAPAVLTSVTHGDGGRYGATDIPDWCYTESGSQVAYAQPLPEQYAKAMSMSPMAHVSKITAPILLLVGGDDRRVPPFQSKEFYYALKERGANVEMLWYDKHTHGLTETPKGEGDGLVNICYFFDKHL